MTDRPRTVDREHPGVRAELVERGLVIEEDRVTVVAAVLGIERPETVDAILIDRRVGQVTVIRTSRRFVWRDGQRIETAAENREHYPLTSPKEGE